MNRKIVLYLIVISSIVLVLGLFGGTEYYFRDFVVHKSLNILVNNGDPEFFKKPSFVCYIDAFFYYIFAIVLKCFHVVSSMDNFVEQFPKGYFIINGFRISYMLPALLLNNIFAVLGAVFTFFTSYIILKKTFPAFLAGIFLATSYMWMCFSHHLTVDIPLAALSIMTVYFAIYFLEKKDFYNPKELIILGVLIGLTASAKYNGALVAVPIIAAVVYTNKQNYEKLFKDILIIVLYAIIAFLVTNPFILVDWGHFVGDFLFELNHASTGHKGSDDKYPFLFNLAHNLPSGFGLIPLVLALLGLYVFVKDENIAKKVKIIFLSFPVAFYLYMSTCSKLVFLRYMLPMIPFLSVLVSFSFSYAWEKIKTNKSFLSILILILVGLGLCQNIYNSILFLRVMANQDTRYGIKNIFNSLGINAKNQKIYHSEIFSNYYYQDDFLNEQPGLTKVIRKYLYEANNTSMSAAIPIYESNQTAKSIFQTFDIVILDDKTFDKYVYIRKKANFANLENQYFLYKPYRRRSIKFDQYDGNLYVVQVSPFSKDKADVPFESLRSDLKYRTSHGPFVEIYFKNKSLAERFIDKCLISNLKCSGLIPKEQGYYYKIFAKREYGVGPYYPPQYFVD